MSRQETLKSLEQLLESFLGRAVAAKEKRMRVIDGVDRLGGLFRESTQGADITDRIGEWFAEHNQWLADNSLKPADVDRISRLLGGIKRKLDIQPDHSPAQEKINSEIGRWDKAARAVPTKVVLKRGAERVPLSKVDGDTIGPFETVLARMMDLFKDYAASKKHVLSALDDALKSAVLQRNKDTLLLSAFIIYYLKIEGYKVEPYVKRLKQAESLIHED